MNEMTFILIILIVIVFSTTVILNKWIDFVDKEKERREKKNIDFNIPKFNFTKFNRDNIIIDVDCEIIEETNDRRKYLSIENKDH